MENKPYVFLCHSHKETDIEMTKCIESLKTLFDKNSIEYFIDDYIESGSHWQENLLNGLKRADVIAVFANEDLKNSAYCHLERGVAYGWNIPEYIISRPEDKHIKLKEFNETQKSKNIFLGKAWTKELLNFINKKHQEKQEKIPVAVSANLPQTSLTVPTSPAPSSKNSKTLSEEVVKSKLNQAEKFIEQREYEFAENIFNALLKTNLPINCQIELFHKKGEMYYEKCNYDETLTYYMKALEIQETVFEDTDTRLVASYDSIGKVHRGKAEYDKALDFFQKSLNIWIVNESDMESTNIAESYNNIGKVYSYKAEFHRNVALAYCKKGDYLTALDYLNVALKFCEEKLGKQNIYTSLIYQSLADTYWEMGDSEKADEYCKKARGEY
jgi:tetratricopeptide (TPR) repeat protein